MIEAYYSDESVRILCGSALNLDIEPVQCVVTSPPYWGLRKYDGEQELVWGDCECEHEWGEVVTIEPNASGGPTAKQVSNTGSYHAEYGGRRRVSGTCLKCGAWRGAYGLEPTPELYVQHTVLFLREIRRVLKDDGCVFWNVGDSYASGKGSCFNPGGGENSLGQERKADGAHPLHRGNVSDLRVSGLKPKDLCMIPARVALAAQADGWWLRSDIIWCLSGGTWLYVRSQKGDMPMTVKDMARLDPSTVQLWNGEKWTRLLGMSKSPRKGDEIELVLRSGERISCTPTHRFPTSRGLLGAADIKVGDVLQSCRLPEPEQVKDCAINEDAAWFAGLYIAEGSRSGDTIQIAGHAKEDVRWNEIQRIAEKFGGSATRTVDGHNMSIRVYGRVLNAIVDELVTGHTSHDKGFAPVVWRYSNQFIESMLGGYLAGDGCYEGGRWRLGFCRNYNLERDLRTACARLGYALTLNLSSVPYNGKQVPTFRGELRMKRNGHWNEKDRNEVVEIRKARCRDVYDIGVEDEPHTFALASGVLTHNSKPNPMPESVRDRPTSSYEHIFMFTKSKDYYWNASAVREPMAPESVARYEYAFGGPANEYLKAHEKPTAVVGNRVPTDGRNIRDVWTIATQPSGFKHYASFPEEIPTRCIKAATKPGDLVLDPFCGTGRTLYAAQKLGRNAVGVDLSATYCEMARKRMKGQMVML